MTKLNLRSLAFAWLVLWSAGVSAAEFSFAPAVFYQIGDWRNDTAAWGDSIAVGDVTGDGRDDIVMATTTMQVRLLPSDHTVFVYKQGSNGTLLAPRAYPYSAGLADYYEKFTTSGVAIGDLNNDGIGDIVVGYGHGVATFVADGAGGFTAPHKRLIPSYSYWDTPKHVALLDANRDGNLDAVVINFGGMTTLFYGNGTGDFTSAKLLSESETRVYDAKVGDMTNDGYQDVVVLSDAVKILPGAGAAGIGAPIEYRFPHTGLDYSGGSTFYVGGIAVGDWNRDGRNDIAVTDFANFTSDGDHPDVVIYDQDAQGGLAAPHLLPTTLGTPEHLLSMDLDRDGDLDLTTLHHTATFGLYLNRGTGQFAPERLQSLLNDYLSYETQGVAAGDVNGDGCTDVALANYNFAVTVLRGRGCAAASAPRPFVLQQLDTNHDGHSDLLFRDIRRHRFYTWRMNGTSVSGMTSTGIGDAYHLAGSGDFNGDMRTDMLWTSDANDLVIASSSGTAFTGKKCSLTYGVGWHVLDATDVNGDGMADILLRNDAKARIVVWYMQGCVLLGYSSQSVPQGYEFVGSGDLNGDGRQDLVWTNSARDILISLNNGRGSFETAAQGLIYSSQYTLAGIADVNGNGSADLLFRSKSLGKLVTWFMRGRTRVAYSATTIGGSYRLTGKGDFNGDSRVDLVWINANKQVMFSLSQGSTFSNSLSRAPFPNGSLMDTD